MLPAVPRVPRRAQVPVRPPAAHGELHRVGLAEDDHAGTDETFRERGGERRYALGPEPAAAGGDATLHVDEILERDGHSVQRPHRVAGVDGAIGRCRGATRIVGIDIDEGVQLRVVARDSFEIEVDELRGLELARGD